MTSIEKNKKTEKLLSSYNYLNNSPYYTYNGHCEQLSQRTIQILFFFLNFNFVVVL